MQTISVLTFILDGKPDPQGCVWEGLRFGPLVALTAEFKHSKPLGWARLWHRDGPDGSTHIMANIEYRPEWVGLVPALGVTIVRQTMDGERVTINDAEVVHVSLVQANIDPRIPPIKALLPC